MKMKKIEVDAHLPYLLEAKNRKLYKLLILADVRYLPFRPRSVDVVMALDLIEHLDKEDGLKILMSMEKIARKKLIIFTPLGFLPLKPYDTILQLHRSGWYPKEFRTRGYKCRGVNGLFFLRGEGVVLELAGS